MRRKDDIEKLENPVVALAHVYRLLRNLSQCGRYLERYGNCVILEGYDIGMDKPISSNAKDRWYMYDSMSSLDLK